MSNLKKLAVIVLGAAAALGGAELGYRSVLAGRCLMPARRSDLSAFEIHGVGESTMQGEPYRNLSIPFIVAGMFGGKALGRPIVVKNWAMAGQSIYPQAYLFREAVRCKDPRVPGVVFVYSGHNDAGGPPEPTWDQSLREALENRSELVRRLYYELEKRVPAFRMRSRYSYELNLRRVIETSRRKGLIPVLSTVIGNIADVDPGLDGPVDQAWYDAGEALLARGRAREALAHFQAAEPTISNKGYLFFELAKCREALGEYGAARELFWQAVEIGLGGNFGRATRERNDIVRRLAAENGIPVVDAVDLFQKAARHGLPGNELFEDGHHPNIKGVALLSEAFARAMSGAVGEPLRAHLDAASTPEALFKRLNYPVSDQVGALLSSGGWLLSVSAHYPRPRLRMELAGSKFARALALDPHSLSARIGLCLAEAGKKGFFNDEDNLRWFARNNLFFAANYELSLGRHAELIERLEKSEASPACLSAIRNP